jgi:hypothetical protein
LESKTACPFASVYPVWLRFLRGATLPLVVHGAFFSQSFFKKSDGGFFVPPVVVLRVLKVLRVLRS